MMGESFKPGDKVRVDGKFSTFTVVRQNGEMLILSYPVGDAQIEVPTWNVYKVNENE